ncbi:PadR family transcriptional regulator [Streptomyces sp. NPDC004721]
MTDRRINATAASLLGFLHQGPMSGWDLVAIAQQQIGGFWSLTPSQVYRELASMAKAKLVEAGEPGRRDRRPYAISEEGRAAFREWVSSEPGPETIRFPLLLTVLFSAHLPADQLADSLRTHREVHMNRMAQYKMRWEELHAAGETEPHLTATLAFGLKYEQAILSWFEELPSLLGRANATDSP